MKFNVEEIKEYIIDNPEARIIIGGDSQKIGRKGSKKSKDGEPIDKYARFVTCVVVYEKDANKIFWEVTKERDNDTNPGKPYLRMMQETTKIVEIADQLMGILIDRDFQIHLDIASDKKFGSYCALSTATGYVWGMLGVQPVVKPYSFCASTIADHIVKTYKDVLNYK